MKTLNFRILGFILCSSLTVSTYAQNWTLGGNASPPLNGTNNILGTNANFPINIVTNGIQRVKVNGIL
ncbi:MAG: hypothetical protein H6587_03490 [Flavobacteriales bacterium]|nr:hypothetical protein [Flavobacteriales bacterium]MCB9363612.1 hypothetical protein [Flavobacteriales bacterium]